VYVPHFNAVHDREEIRALVRHVGSAELVTVGPDGTPLATLLPILWRDGGDDGAGDGTGDGTEGSGVVVAHMARANQHWRTIAPGSRALALVAGPQAYVSPSWYPAKAEHGRVVPTWNYSAVHLSGTVTVHDDPDWVRGAVTALTERHEGPREVPWGVTDAPAGFVDKQLRAIVGIELVVDRVEAKAKLSQNRSEADQAGVVAGLRREGHERDALVADAMQRWSSAGG
jgi:transcriptional regulator